MTSKGRRGAADHCFVPVLCKVSRNTGLSGLQREMRACVLHGGRKEQVYGGEVSEFHLEHTKYRGSHCQVVRIDLRPEKTSLQIFR